MRTILAVDDRKEILAGIEQLLSGECQVIAVSNGTEIPAAEITASRTGEY